MLLKALQDSAEEDGEEYKSQLMKGLYILLLDKRYDPNYISKCAAKPSWHLFALYSVSGRWLTLVTTNQ